MSETVQVLAKQGIRAMLELVGRGNDEATRETPGRVLKAFLEMTEGYQQDPQKILAKQFDCDTDELIIVRGIRFVSLCEHHLLPFSGTATVAYIPAGKVIGLSKIPRLVECFAKRLQLQERMTGQIANSIVNCIDTCMSAACVITASHSCMSCRGVKQLGAEMITSCLIGRFRSDPSLRAELMALK